MKILITGGAGFIGSQLCKIITDQHQVLAVDNFDDFYPRQVKLNNLLWSKGDSNFQLFEVDIRDNYQMEQVFNTNSIDLVIHLAAKAGVRPSMQNPSEYIDVNINGTINLLNYMNKYGVKKLIFASSSSVYGENTKVPFNEKDDLKSIISTYAITKKTGEDLVRMYHTLYKFSVVILRFFTVYGPSQRPDLAIYKFVDSIVHDKEISIYGDGSTERDYTYIDDIVDGIIKAAEYLRASKTPVLDIFNLGNSSPEKLSKLIETIENVLNKKANKRVLPLPIGDVKSTYADISKAKRVLKYQPITKLEKGIETFVTWYMSQSL
ncbi:MAG: NAD-dependent epimerase/dehydratase family protein [Salinivirgaceae bacterium]